MIIDGNEIEKAAMKEFHKGNRKEGLRIMEEVASAFREEYKEKDHCSCKKACRSRRAIRAARFPKSFPRSAGSVSRKRSLCLRRGVRS